MTMRFLHDIPALFVKGALVIADLHLGFEAELRKSGILVPDQSSKILSRIFRIIEDTGASTLIILGDVKHKVPGISWHEERKIPKFLDALTKKVEVHIVRGNHDAGLERLIASMDAKKVRIHPATGFVINGVALAHGHAWPGSGMLKVETIILGHNHPTIRFRDRLGFSSLEHVWILAKIDKKKLSKHYKCDKSEISLHHTVIMPVFNPLVGGIAFNEVSQNELLGPIVKVLQLESAHVHMLDGTDLGKLSKLKI